MRTLRKGSKDRERQLRSRQRLLALLDKLGIDPSVIRTLPERLRHIVYDVRSPGITIELDPDAAGVEACRAAAGYLEEWLAKGMLPVPGTDRQICVADFAGPLRSFWSAAYALQTAGKLDARAAAALKPILDLTPAQIIDSIFDAMHAQQFYISQCCSRLDSNLCYVESVNHGCRHRLVVHAARPKAREFKIDGKPRPAHRAGGFFSNCGFVWLEYAPQLLDLPDARPHLPVFVQRHVFRRLTERLSAAHQSIAHLMMVSSLGSPQITRGSDGKIWIACKHPVGPLGYFVADVVDDCVLVKSFLFLTMTGTPQHRALRKRLAAQSRDIEYLGLDQLDTYVNSDLADDPQLSKIFGDCGLSHLLQLREHWGDAKKIGA